jgi:hypothetical protein
LSGRERPRPPRGSRHPERRHACGQYRTATPARRRRSCARRCDRSRL